MLLRTLRIALITFPLAALCILLMGLTTATASLIERSGNLAHRVASFWGRFLLFVSGVRVDTEGLEHVPRNEGLVLVANHRSMMDIAVLMGLLPVSFRFLAKRSLFKLPFIGWHLFLGGHVGVDREDKRAAVKAMARAREILGQNISVLIFAEGGRSEEGMRSFKGGAAYLAIKAGARVLPIGLTGTRDALPRGSIHIRPARVTLRVGEPIATASLTSRDQAELTDRLQTAVSRLIAPPAAGDR